MKYTNSSNTSNSTSQTNNTTTKTNTSYKLNSSPVINDNDSNKTTTSTNANNNLTGTNKLSSSTESLKDIGYEGDNKVDSTFSSQKDKLFESLDTLKNDDELIRTLWSNGIYRKNDYNDFSEFYIFPRRDPYKMLGTTREYIFITRPDLHIFGSTENNNYITNPVKEVKGELNPELKGSLFFTDLFARGYKEVLESLNYSYAKDCPFVNLLSNYKTSNIELTNLTVGDEETAANIFNTKIFYRKPSDSADEESEITIEFKDNKYLDCYIWFKAYDMYERLKYQGKVTPVNWDYTMYKVLSDQMTIFRFVVGEDGETIVHWAQMWGCYPKSVPRAVLSDMPEDGQLRFTVDWKVTFQSDMDPLTIAHFKALCRLYMNRKALQQIKLYDTKSQRITGESAGIPYIERSSNTNPRQMYKLIWYKKLASF